MSRLSAQCARRFRAARVPSYPRVAALGLLVVGVACQAAGTTAPPPATSEQPAATANTSAPTVLVLATPPPSNSVPELAAPPDEHAPRFVEDEAALNVVNAPCRGDCASPFQIAASKKDQAQVQARATFCARSNPGAGTATLRATVGKDGRAEQIAFEKSDSAPPEGTLECVRRLVSTGRFTPPDGSAERFMYATFRVPPR